MEEKEKAKAYEKVRENIALRFGSNVAEEIFSVFEESEDERMRKAIIELVKQSSEILSKSNRDGMLAWLEKQGGSKQEWSEEDERLIKTTIGFLKDFSDKGYEKAVECIDWLKSLKTTNVSNSSITVEGMYNPTKDASV